MMIAASKAFTMRSSARVSNRSPQRDARQRRQEQPRRRAQVNVPPILRHDDRRDGDRQQHRQRRRNVHWDPQRQQRHGDERLAKSERRSHQRREKDDRHDMKQDRVHGQRAAYPMSIVLSQAPELLQVTEPPTLCDTNMALADRDYIRTPSRPPVGVMQMWSVNTWIIVINIAVFVLDSLTTRYVFDPQTGLRFIASEPFAQLGHFSYVTAIQHLQVWRFITFQFLHANTTHILFNMFALYMFGPLIESYLGRRRFLGFYLLSGIGGAVMYVVLLGLGFFGRDPRAAAMPLVGASAGIFGVLVAAARVAPHATVLIYGAIPMRLRTLAWVLIAIAVLTIFSHGMNAGGEAAHLGGAAVGFLLISNPQWLNFLEAGYHSGRQRTTYR